MSTGFLGFLMKAVQYINGFLKFRHIDDSKLTIFVDADFNYTGTNVFHGFPVIWIVSTLNICDLKSCPSSS